MESLLKGIPGVTVYLDDVLITGATEAKHMNALEEVLRRMRRAGLRLRREKCVLMTSSVVYLGHRIDAEGLHPVSEKVEALQDAPTPTNVSIEGVLGPFVILPSILAKSGNTLGSIVRPTATQSALVMGRRPGESVSGVEAVDSQFTVAGPL